MDSITVASLLHIASDLPAFIGYSFAAIIASNIYTQGQLSSSPEAHPSLWRTGIAFLVLSALVRFASGVQSSLRLAFNYDLIFLTIAFKIPLATVAIYFVYLLWINRYEFIALGLVWKAVGSMGRGKPEDKR